MVLSKPEIERYLARGDLRLDPAPHPSQIRQVSVDLRLGRKFTTFKGLPAHIPHVRIRPSIFESEDLWDHVVDTESFEIEPGAFVLAQTLERVTIPNDLVGFIEGRSSWARVGVSIHLTAPKIDPGFEGSITLEIANVGKATVQLVAEQDVPAQLMLMRLTTPLGVDDVYGANADDAFQYQSDPIPRERGT